MTDWGCGSRLPTGRGGVSVTPWTRTYYPWAPSHHAAGATSWYRYQSAGDALRWSLDFIWVTSHFFPQVRLPAPNQATHPTVYRYYTITVSLTLTLTPSNTASPLGVMAPHCRHPIPGVRREGGRGAYGRMDSWTPYTCFPDNSLAGLFFSLSNGRPKRHVAYFRLAKWATEICSCAS